MNYKIKKCVLPLLHLNLWKLKYTMISFSLLLNDLHAALLKCSYEQLHLQSSPKSPRVLSVPIFSNYSFYGAPYWNAQAERKVFIMLKV